MTQTNRKKPSQRKKNNPAKTGPLGAIAKAWREYKNHTPAPGHPVKRALKKTLLVTAGISIVSLGAAPFIGTSAQDAFRQATKNPAFAVDTAAPDMTNAAAREPLYIGTTETARTIALQENLLTLGYPLEACGANGVFGMAEQRAVNWFRAAAGLKASEFADAHTEDMIARTANFRRKMQAPETVPATLASGIVQKGLAEKAAIRDLQLDLHQAGYKIGDCMFNGNMNSQTVSALESFQKEARIYPVTGAADVSARRSLHDAARSRANEDGVEFIVPQNGLDYLSKALYGQMVSEKDVRAMAIYHIQQGGIPEYIVQAIMEASLQTGMDFSYMMDLAKIESSYKPWSGAGTTSARGSFQFIEETWLRTFRKHGGKYGYQDLVNKMGGAQEKQYVLDLRKDPKISALMAAEFAHDNLDVLKSKVKRGTLGKPDLYLAHFLGATEGARFIIAFRNDPNQSAAKLFAGAASRNAGVFYINGREKTLGEIYKTFSGKMTGHALRMTVSRTPKKLTDTVFKS